MRSFIKKIVNTKLWHIQKSFGNKPFVLLDVGAGNQSASKVKSIFRHCSYFGLDIDKNTNYVDADFTAMEAFYEMDLTQLNYTAIPDNHFDYINMAHVIEHLHNGDLVVPALLKKLKRKGFFYIEYPCKKSLHLPSMYGSLNFYDDPTHVRVYSVEELKPIFEQHGCEIIACGTRRNWFYILALPLRLIASLIETGKIRGNVFWDVLGFAEFLYVRKK